VSGPYLRNICLARALCHHGKGGRAYKVVGSGLPRKKECINCLTASMMDSPIAKTERAYPLKAQAESVAQGFVSHVGVQIGVDVGGDRNGEGKLAIGGVLSNKVRSDVARYKVRGRGI